MIARYEYLSSKSCHVCFHGRNRQSRTQMSGVVLLLHGTPYTQVENTVAHGLLPLQLCIFSLLYFFFNWMRNSFIKLLIDIEPKLPNPAVITMIGRSLSGLPDEQIRYCL